MGAKIRTNPLYLIYGDNVSAMQDARDNILASLLPPEERNENLTEYIGTGNKFGISFEDILGDINADLSTMSLLADTKKVVVVTDPIEIFASEFKARRKPAKPKKAKPKSKTGDAEDANAEPPYVRWLKQTLPKTGNHLIIIANTDEAEDRDISDTNPLFQAITQAHGELMRFQSGTSKAIYRIEDAIVMRQPDQFFKEIEELWTDKTNMNIYNQVTRAMRFMIQAGILRDPRVAGDIEKQSVLLPASARTNLTKLHAFPQQKYTRNVGRYRMVDLIKAYQELIEVYLALRPRPGVIYVQDARLALDRVMATLFASPQPGRR